MKMKIKMKGGQEAHDYKLKAGGFSFMITFGPLGPAPAHPIQSLRDGWVFRLRGGIHVYESLVAGDW